MGWSLESEIRVLVAVDKASRDWLVEAIASERDMRIVGQAEEALETLLMAKEIRTDIVLVDLPESGEDPGIASHLLAEFPELAVIAVSPSRDRLRVFRAILHQEELTEDSAAEIGDAIRHARGPEAPAMPKHSNRGPATPDQ